jgi:hypothetical protein
MRHKHPHHADCIFSSGGLSYGLDEGWNIRETEIHLNPCNIVEHLQINSKILEILPGFHALQVVMCLIPLNTPRQLAVKF